MSDRYRDALYRIARGRLPCSVCGEVHIWRVNLQFSGGAFFPEPNGGTWAGNDGHSYWRMSPAEYAASVLGEEQAG